MDIGCCCTYILCLCQQILCSAGHWNYSRNWNEMPMLSFCSRWCGLCKLYHGLYLNTELYLFRLGKHTALWDPGKLQVSVDYVFWGVFFSSLRPFCPLNTSRNSVFPLLWRSSHQWTFRWQLLLSKRIESVRWKYSLHLACLFLTILSFRVFSDAAGSTDGRCVIRPPHKWCTIQPDNFFLIANPDTSCTLNVRHVNQQTNREEYASNVMSLDQMSTCLDWFLLQTLDSHSKELFMIKWAHLYPLNCQCVSSISLCFFVVFFCS